MKITHIANACCIYEADGYQILCDPWLKDGAFEGSWYHYPPLQSKPSDFFNVNAIYMSHLHPDHFDEATLKEFPKTIPIFYLDKAPNFLKKKLDALGFTELIGIKHGESKQFGPFKITMLEPFVGNLFYESVIGNIIDSSIVIECGGFRVLNGNDNPPTLEIAKKLKEKWGHFDVVQLVDSCAGPYPMCFRNLPDERKKSEKERIINRHLELMIACAKEMNATYMQPFAGHYQLGGRLVDRNPYLAVHDPKEVADAIEKAGLKPLLLYERDDFDLSTGLFFRLDNAYSDQDRKGWEAKVKQNPFTYDSLELPSNEELNRAAFAATTNLRAKQKQYGCYPKWICNIGTDNWSYEFSFGELGYKNLQFGHIKMIMDRKLLWGILTKQIHYNNAEVGCHIDFYRTPNEYDADLHLLMCFFHI